MNYPVFPCGDCALSIQIGNEISEAVNREVVAVLSCVQRENIPGVLELVPSYTCICIHYDPAVIDYDGLMARLRKLEVQTEQFAEGSSRVVEIPVCYGGEYGPDLAYVAEYHHISEEEVIRRHSSGDYLVYMLGFLPGFAYMGGMDESISCPRLASPRTKIPAGSVGIAGSQTGIYPLASPGGWQLIGRTPVKMFEMMGETAKFTLSAGDRVQFVPISEEEFLAMEGQA